jgi:hypothetical protein
MKTLEFWEEASEKTLGTKGVILQRIARLKSKLNPNRPCRLRRSIIISIAVNHRLLSKLAVKLEYYEERKRAILNRSRFDRILRSPVI